MLDLSGSTALTYIECYDNKIKGEMMDALISCLPIVEKGGFVVLFSHDGNECTPAQVALANAKGWTAYQHDGSNWVEMESDEMAIPDEAIDLGLPSGTKWAPWNVGASKPEDYGGYYAWGETEEKEVYNWSTYIHCDGSEETCHNIGMDIAGTEYDVAHEKWGGSWRMPSLDQIQELLDICTQTWTQQNDVNGTLVTGPNGNSIFLPAAGYRWGDSLRYEGTNGHYWSSSLYPSYSLYAYSLFFGSSYWDGGYSYRYYGQSVRAVCP